MFEQETSVLMQHSGFDEQYAWGVEMKYDISPIYPFAIENAPETLYVKYNLKNALKEREVMRIPPTCYLNENEMIQRLIEMFYIKQNQEAKNVPY